ncbi:MAG: c-type cytochrome biogenesis protein CcmI [Gammaproteobacteria bacterium]|jgi:cytochrome c-type biogenesis protein CcmH
MLIFATLVTLLLLLALAMLVTPLLRKTVPQSVVERSEANLQILRDQVAELEADLRNGTLSQQQYEVARSELERRVLEESEEGDAGAQRTPGASRWVTPLLIAVLVPLAAVGMYGYLGEPEGLDVQAYLQEQAAAITPDDVARMTGQLEEHLAANPDDAEGWAMLGRVRRAMQQYEASAEAWKNASRLLPDDATVLANYAEALGLAASGDLSGEPTRLLARALEMDPQDAKALALSGSAAFAREDYQSAIGYWGRLLELSEGDPELAQALRTGIAEAQARLGNNATAETTPGGADSAPSASAKAGSATAVTGSVSLSPDLAQSVNPDDVVFIFAKAADGPGMPLAVTRIKVGDLPYRFRLDDSMAMTPAGKISGAGQLVVGARVSNSGNAARSSGDLEGFSKVITAGASDVDVVIDRRVP